MGFCSFTYLVTFTHFLPWKPQNPNSQFTHTLRSREGRSLRSSHSDGFREDQSPAGASETGGDFGRRKSEGW